MIVCENIDSRVFAESRIAYWRKQFVFAFVYVNYVCASAWRAFSDTRYGFLATYIAIGTIAGWLLQNTYLNSL